MIIDLHELLQEDNSNRSYHLQLEADVFETSTASYKIKDYETTDYRKYQQACGNPGIGYRNTYADRQRYHAYRYDCTAPAHRRNHRISFQSSSTDCQDSIYLFHCRTPVFLTNKTYRYENKYMYIFRSCHAGCMATE
jgi:hypothetical protein